MEEEDKQSRNWCFTVNNATEDDDNWFYSLEYVRTITYGIAGLEYAPTTGTRHLQGYLEFRSSTRLSSLKVLHPTAHYEPRYGTQEQAIKYCKKDGDYYEFGTKKPTAQESGQKGAAERWQLIKAGEFEQLPPEQYYTYKRIYSEMNVPPDLSPDNSCNTTNLWIMGPPGIGKSRWVRANHPREEIYFKALNKWWDGYNHEPVVLIEDIDRTIGKFLMHYMKQWADMYTFKAEVKNSSMLIRPQHIIVTSNETIDETFADFPQIHVDAIKRRFRTVTIVNNNIIDI